MFSSRTDWDRTPNALARLRAELLADGEPILDLTESNPTRCGFEYPADAILRGIADPASLSYDPDPKGMREARNEVAGTFAAPIDPEQVVLTASTSEAYSWLFKMLCNPGDEVLVPCPSYPLFDFLARLEGVRLVPYPLSYEGRWHLDGGELEGKIGPRARALIVVQPNNPTGSYLNPAEIEIVRGVCRDLQLVLISDEVFLPYRVEAVGEEAPSLIGATEVLTFVLGGLSKRSGLPQMKLAWIATVGPEREREEALARLDLIGDTYLSPGAPAQCGVGALLAAGEKVQRQILERIALNRDLLKRIQGADSPWECLRLEGGWSAVLRLPRIVPDHDWALTLLEKDRLYVHPGYFFDFPGEGYLVVSLLPEEGLFREGIRRLDRRVRTMAG